MFIRKIPYKYGQSSFCSKRLQVTVTACDKQAPPRCVQAQLEGCTHLGGMPGGHGAELIGFHSKSDTA